MSQAGLLENVQGYGAIDYHQYRGPEASQAFASPIGTLGSSEAIVYSGPQHNGHLGQQLPHSLASFEYQPSMVSISPHFESHQSLPKYGPTIVKTQTALQHSAHLGNHLASREVVTMPQVPKYETLAHPQARASLHAASSAQTVNYGQPKTASMTLKDFSQGEYLTASEAIQHKLFLSMLLNMVNDEKAKRSPAKDRHFGPRQTKPSIEKQPIAIIERNQKVIVKAPGPAIDSRSQSSDVGGMILKLETTLNDLERHNASLVRENIGLKQKLRGVEDLYGLKEDETAEVVTKAKTLLDSAQSPFFRANTSVRAFTSQKAKGGLQGQQYGDHVRDKIEANEKIRTMKAEIGQLQEENTLLKHKNQTYETEINELYHRIDKFGSLESSVAELIQENERLRQIVVKITGQLHQNF